MTRALNNNVIALLFEDTEKKLGTSLSVSWRDVPQSLHDLIALSPQNPTTTTKDVNLEELYSQIIIMFIIIFSLGS